MCFKNGDRLKIVNAKNEVVGYGIYEKEGLIGIRVLKKGKDPPGPEWFRSQLQTALKKRENLRKYTEAFRAIHGENDGFPGIVIDVYGIRPFCKPTRTRWMLWAVIWHGFCETS